MREKISIVISSHPEILSGTPVFSGTRVPVKSLFDFLEAGRTIEFFLEQFPSVKKKQVLAVFNIAEHMIIELKTHENSSRRVPT
jgi:uncharacterized protein (DUF433 family)